MKFWLRYFCVPVLFLLATSDVGYAAGDPEKGRRLYRACVACHSLEPGRHLTGPSLAAIWGRKAGTVKGFRRYTKALERSKIVWDGRSLDGWLANPRTFIPGSLMTFRGMRDQGQRSDLIAFLRQVSKMGERARKPQAGGKTGRGMMGRSEPLKLRSLGQNNKVTSVGYCRDTYTVATKTRGSHKFWEYNLRFKTDSSDNGPDRGHPVLIPAGMRGDRAFLIFASPREISAFIKVDC